VLSVLIITVGVILTTLSSRRRDETVNASFLGPRYLTGIGILTLALVFSGFLGVVQDKTYASYSGHSPTHNRSKKAGYLGATKMAGPPNIWKESMFYLHFLALPMFVPLRHDLMEQARAVLSSHARTTTFPLAAAQIEFPSVLPALLANTLTQLLCVAGVNRLTTRVPALTVTLVLVVRKAVSLVLSVVLFDGSEVNWNMLWSGAFLVFAGTVGYAVSGRVTKKDKKDKKA
jgi:solute carrier family 35 (UDP-xylose/UDP-N-acetylglucosamine transporter), member B4